MSSEFGRSFKLGAGFGLGFGLAVLAVWFLWSGVQVTPSLLATADRATKDFRAALSHSFQRTSYATFSAKCGDTKKADRVFVQDRGPAPPGPGRWYWIEWETDNDCDAEIIVDYVEILGTSADGQVVGRGRTDLWERIPPGKTSKRQGWPVLSGATVEAFDVSLRLGYNR